MGKSIAVPHRTKALRTLEKKHGTEYAIVRNQQIQVGNSARDFLKEFSTYIGADGKGSRSAMEKDASGNWVVKATGGAVHVAVAKQIKTILGFSAGDMDAIGNPEMVSKACLSWAKVMPVLSAAAERRLPRQECFALLWDKFREISAI